jgi:segregation and condensation protein B
MPSLKSILEGLLFISDTPVKISSLLEILPEYNPKEIKTVIKILISEYQDRGITIEEVAGGYRFQTNQDLSDYIIRLKKVMPFKLSPSTMETLAIIAYKQPVTRAEIELIRGVNSQNSLKILIEKGIVKMAGKKEIPGRPILYGTTRYFLELFGLKDISSLPDPKDLENSLDSIPLFKKI